MIAWKERMEPMPRIGKPGPDHAVSRDRMRRRRSRRPAGHPRSETLYLHFPERQGPGGFDFAWAGAALMAFGILIYAAAHLPVRAPAGEETVEWVEETVPPPVEEVKELPKPPPPPPPDPDVVPPPPRAEEAPPPVFGIPEDAVSEAGDMAVATGNTLRTQADSLVQPPPPPLPAAPVELDKTPAFLKQAMAEYPEWALDQGVEARVLVWVTIDAEGAVTEASLKKGAGRDFDASAMRAARMSLFQPLVREGMKLPSRFVVTYDFRLE
jgi:protein TonB